MVVLNIVKMSVDMIGLTGQITNTDLQCNFWIDFGKTRNLHVKLQKT